MCHMNKPVRQAQGFTLAEIMVVVAIVGIAAAMVVPMIGDTSDIQAASAARMLMSDLEYAQGRAMVTQSPVTVAFDTDAGSYLLRDAGGTTLTHPVTHNPFAVSLAASGMGDTALSQVNFGGVAAVTFDALGAPNAAGFVVLLAGSSGRRIDLAAVTGKATVQVVAP